MIINKYKFLFILAVILSCQEQHSSQDTEAISPVDTGNVIIKPEPVSIDKDSMLLQQTKQVLSIIKNKDYSSLAGFIHPVTGIRFSPYAYISNTDRQFSREDFLQALKKQDKMHWGTYSGSGDSILFTMKEYFEKFVYDVDFLHAQKTTVNHTSTRGSAINNQETFYKGLDYTESYFPGFEKKYGGMDWRGLRLIFKEYEGDYFLTAIVHDEWTP